MAHAAASNQILQNFARQEAANFSRKRAVSELESQWSTAVDFGTSGADAAVSTVSNAASSSPIQQLIQMLSEMVVGPVTSSARRFFASLKTYFGTGTAAAVIADKKPATAFTQDQEHALTGLLEVLHKHYTFEISQERKRTLMLCGLSVLASVSAAAASYYFLHKKQQSNPNNNSNAATNDDDTAASSPVKIKTLNFRGHPDELISLLDKLKQAGTPVEIEHASVNNTNSSSGHSSWFSQEHEVYPPPQSPMMMAGQENITTVF